MSDTLREIRIYVACLASYNNGILHGRWIDATLGEDHIWKETKSMLKSSPMVGAEEWAIHDYEGFEGCQLSEYSDFSHIAELATFIETHGVLGAKLIEHYGDLEDAHSAIEGHYAGPYDSAQDFAREITEQTTENPQPLAFYVDYEKMAHDSEINDVLTIETDHNVHVFWRH